MAVVLRSSFNSVVYNVVSSGLAPVECTRWEVGVAGEKLCMGKCWLSVRAELSYQSTFFASTATTITTIYSNASEKKVDRNNSNSKE